MAWRGGRNTSAISIAKFVGSILHVVKIFPAIAKWSDVLRIVSELDNVKGIAIDAPLIIKNSSSLRHCERELNKVYAGIFAGCHSTNLTLYPDADSVQLSVALKKKGYSHLEKDGPFQIEVYPHPALIEIFNLSRRHLYKKGSVQERRKGQVALSDMIKGLVHSSIIPLQLSRDLDIALDASGIMLLCGQKLKQNEDAMDSIICAYIAGLHSKGLTRIFGDKDEGYIVVPSIN